MNNLTGVWYCDDNGKYYVVQMGLDIYWYGEQRAVDPEWSNIAFGTIDGDRITLQWTDVPKGSMKQNGELILKITESEDADKIKTLTTVSKTGSFGGSTWILDLAMSDDTRCIHPSMQMNVNRPGSDYRDFDLDEPDPCTCMDACNNESICRAYTYVKPGVQGEKARCWLKTDIPDPEPNSDCISGNSTRIIPTSSVTCNDSGMEDNINRPGKDYKDFDLIDPNPCDCMIACNNESICRAYTYVRPGVQGEKARCWLKTDIPDPEPNSDCISGVILKPTPTPYQTPAPYPDLHPVKIDLQSRGTGNPGRQVPIEVENSGLADASPLMSQPENVRIVV